MLCLVVALEQRVGGAYTRMKSSRGATAGELAFDQRDILIRIRLVRPEMIDHNAGTQVRWYGMIMLNNLDFNSRVAEELYVVRSFVCAKCKSLKRL